MPFLLYSFSQHTLFLRMYIVDARHKGTSQTIFELLRDRKSIQVTSYLFFSFQGVAGLCKATVAYSAPILCRTSTDSMSPPTHCLYISTSSLLSVSCDLVLYLALAPS
jgi:hypothetical protein